MSQLRQLLFTGARALALPSLARRVRPGAIVLCYHNVVAEPVVVADPALHLQVYAFARQMDFLAHHFDVVSLDELQTRSRRGASLRGLAAITFDDAYHGTLANALPVLRTHGLPCTIFVPTGFPGAAHGFWWDDAGARRAAEDPAVRDRWLEQLQGDGARIRLESGAPQTPAPAVRVADWAALRAIQSESVALGAHTRSHRALVQLDDASLMEECAGSAADIERETGATARWLAYPYGIWDERVARTARAAGFAGALTLAGGDVVVETAPWATPRINVPASITEHAFEAWLSGFAHLRRQR